MYLIHKISFILGVTWNQSRRIQSTAEYSKTKTKTDKQGMVNKINDFC